MREWLQGRVGRLLLATLLLSAAVALTGACGGGSDEPSPTAAVVEAPASTPIAMPATSVPTVAPTLRPRRRLHLYAHVNAHANAYAGSDPYAHTYVGAYSYIHGLNRHPRPSLRGAPRIRPVVRSSTWTKTLHGRTSTTSYRLRNNRVSVTQ